MVSAIDSAKAYPVSAIYFICCIVSLFSLRAMHAFCVILRYHFNCKTIYHKTLNFMIYSIPKYINNLKSQKIKFVKLNIHVPKWLLLIKKFQVDNVVLVFDCEF